MITGAQIKKFLWGVFAIVFLIVVGVWMFLSPTPEHIEDTNGADKYTLQTITERDVVSMEMGSKGTLTKKNKKFSLGSISISDGIEYSSKKFTGVYALHISTLIKGSDIYVNLLDLKQTRIIRTCLKRHHFGAFRFVIVRRR